MKAACAVLTAKQAPHRPGTAPALGLRAGDMTATWYRRPPLPSRPREFCAMNQVLVRLGALCCLVGAGAFGLYRFACDRPRTENPGLHHLPPGVGEYLEGVALSVDLQARLEGNHRRLQAKYAVLTELLADRLTLLAAAGRFAELDADLPEVRKRLAQKYPGVSAEVAWCREVIGHARSVLQLRSPERLESVV